MLFSSIFGRQCKFERLATRTYAKVAFLIVALIRLDLFAFSVQILRPMREKKEEKEERRKKEKKERKENCIALPSGTVKPVRLAGMPRMCMTPGKKGASMVK